MQSHLVSRRLLLAAGLAATTACSGSELDSEINPGLAPVEVRTALGVGELTIDTVKWSKKGRIPPKNGFYVSLKITGRVREKSFLLDPLDLKFEDVTAAVHDVEYGLAGVEPPLRADALKGVDETSGWLSFDVPSGPGHFLILRHRQTEVARLPIPGP